jgi:hypothetical protein
MPASIPPINPGPQGDREVLRFWITTPLAAGKPATMQASSRIDSRITDYLPSSTGSKAPIADNSRHDIGRVNPALTRPGVFFERPLGLGEKTDEPVPEYQPAVP